MRKLGFGSRFYIIAVFLLAAAATASAQTFTFKNFNFADGGKAAYGPLIQGPNGNLYGTTTVGGGPDNCPDPIGCGTVFEMTPAGKITPIYNFCSQLKCADGEEPQAGLILGADGNFYGTTFVGGNLENCPFGIGAFAGCGTVSRSPRRGN